VEAPSDSNRDEMERELVNLTLASPRMRSRAILAL
jgi:hypothetical protein